MGQHPAVLDYNVVRTKGDASLKEGRVEVEQKCRQGAIYDSFLYDYPEIKMPAEVKIAHTATVVANLYDAEDSVRIWAVQSTCFDRETWPEVVVDQTNSIARRLQLSWLQDQ